MIPLIIEMRITKKILWFFILSIGFTWYNFDYAFRKDIEFKKEYINMAKKGNVLIRKTTGGRKSRTGIYGKILESSDNSEVYVPYYELKVNFALDSGSIYPVWFTSDKKLIFGRVEETSEKMEIFFENQKNDYIKKIKLIYYGILIALFSTITIDIIRYQKNK